MSIAAVAIMGLVALVVGFVLLVISPDLQYVAFAIIALGIIMLASAFIIEFRNVRKALTSKTGKFRTGTTIMVSAFIGIILLVNSISVLASHTFDFTGLSKFTLTQQTKDVLTDIEDIIDVTCFFVPEDETGAQNYAAYLLTEYRNYTNLLNIKIVDPEANPETARKYNIYSSDYYGTVVFETENGYRRVITDEILAGAEHAFTSAIMEVSGIQQKHIYFLTGHGELSPLDYNDTGYSYAAAYLQDYLYRTYTLDLIDTPYIPSDTSVLVIAAPTTTMNETEIQIISNYLADNGTVMFIVDPDTPEDLKALIAEWGMDISDGTIIEPTQYSAPNKSTPLIDRNRNAFGYSSLYFPGAAAITIRQDAPGTIQGEALVITTENAWVENDASSIPDPSYDSAVDGPTDQYAIAVYISGAPSEYDDDGNATDYYEAPNIIIVSDSDFANNKNIINGSNATLFVNMFNYLTLDQDIITIDRVVLQTRRLIVSPEEATFINVSSIALLPAIVLIIGAIVWWQRR